MKFYTFLLLITFNLNIKSAISLESLDCFQCDYSNYLDCYNNRITCKPSIREQVTCYKFVVKDNLGNIKYKKDCAKYTEYPNEICEFLENQARIQQNNIIGCFNCEYDGCNSTEKLKSFTVLIFLTSFMILLH